MFVGWPVYFSSFNDPAHIPSPCTVIICDGDISVLPNDSSSRASLFYLVVTLSIRMMHLLFVADRDILCFGCLMFPLMHVYSLAIWINLCFVDLQTLSRKDQNLLSYSQ